MPNYHVQVLGMPGEDFSVEDADVQVHEGGIVTLSCGGTIEFVLSPSSIQLISVEDKPPRSEKSRRLP
jgi:hypothetical protein